MADGIPPPTPAAPPTAPTQHPQQTVNNQTTTSTTSTAAALDTVSTVHHAPLMEVDHSPEDRSRRATSVLSMDDIEAAQALEGLRGIHIPQQT